MKIHVGLMLLCLMAAPLAALAQEETDWSLATRLYGDKKARHVGDIVTVVIAEEATSSKDASKGTGKSYTLAGSASVGSPLVDNVPQASWTNAGIPAWALQASSAFSGKGAMENKDKLTGSIAARVTEVLPNGNMLIEGKRTLVIQGESVEFILTGTIRPEDIRRSNIVQSSAIADASIEYVSSGTLAKNQNMGIFPKLWSWINPF